MGERWDAANEDNEEEFEEGREQTPDRTEEDRLAELVQRLRDSQKKLDEERLQNAHLQAAIVPEDQKDRPETRVEAAMRQFHEGLETADYSNLTPEEQERWTRAQADNITRELYRHYHGDEAAELFDQDPTADLSRYPIPMHHDEGQPPTPILMDPSEFPGSTVHSGQGDRSQAAPPPAGAHIPPPAPQPTAEPPARETREGTPETSDAPQQEQDTRPAEPEERIDDPDETIVQSNFESGDAARAAASAPTPEPPREISPSDRRDENIEDSSAGSLGRPTGQGEQTETFLGRQSKETDQEPSLGRPESQADADQETHLVPFGQRQSYTSEAESREKFEQLNSLIPEDQKDNIRVVLDPDTGRWKFEDVGTPHREPEQRPGNTQVAPAQRPERNAEDFPTNPEAVHEMPATQLTSVKIAHDASPREAVRISMRRGLQAARAMGKPVIIGWVNPGEGRPQVYVHAGQAVAGSAAPPGQVRPEALPGTTGQRIEGQTFAAELDELPYWYQVHIVPLSPDESPGEIDLTAPDFYEVWGTDRPAALLARMEPVTTDKADVDRAERSLEAAKTAYREALRGFNPDRGALATLEETIARRQQAYDKIQHQMERIDDPHRGGGQWGISMFAGTRTRAEGEAWLRTLAANMNLTGYKIDLEKTTRVLDIRQAMNLNAAYSDLITTEAVSEALAPPKKEVPGISHDPESTNERVIPLDMPAMTIGTRIDQPGKPFQLTRKDFEERIVLIGAPRSGKTGGMEELIIQSHELGVPSLCIDPVHDNLSTVAARLSGKLPIVVLKFGDSAEASPSLDFYYQVPGNPTERHIAARIDLQTQYLHDPNVISDVPGAIQVTNHQLYREAGIDPDSGLPRRPGEPIGKPTIDGFRQRIYPNTKATYKGSEQRGHNLGVYLHNEVLRKLMTGQGGAIFNGGHPLPPEFANATVFASFAGIQDDELRQLAIGMTVQLYREFNYAERQQRIEQYGPAAAEDQSLRRIIFTDEMHAIAPSHPVGRGAGFSNLFVKSIRADRNDGLSHVMAIQSLKQADPRIPPLAGTRIVFRMAEGDEREAIANTVNATQADLERLDRQPAGRAIVKTSDMVHADPVQFTNPHDHPRLPESKAIPAGEFLNSAHASCGPECGESCCTPHQIHASRIYVEEEGDDLRAWGGLAVANVLRVKLEGGELTPEAVGKPDEDLKARLKELEQQVGRRALECSVGQVVTSIVSKKAKATRLGQVSMDALAKTVAAGMRAAIDDQPAPPPEPAKEQAPRRRKLTQEDAVSLNWSLLVGDAQLSREDPTRDERYDLETATHLNYTAAFQQEVYRRILLHFGHMPSQAADLLTAYRDFFAKNPPKEAPKT